MNLAHLREAIHLSVEHMQNGEGGPFGAVVVRGNEVVGRGWNRVTSTNDPTAHAEIVAIRDACKNLKTFSLEGCEIYSSCEPCPMCMGAILWARLGAVYYAASSEDAAAAGFDDRTIDDEIHKPACQCSIPMKQALRAEACEAFAKWREKPDRVEY